ncbi:MAG: outer membrane beta-barrel protein [Bacteroidaceae bacterium]|nr:outer membrane beta-barrel protein [Bacteroidaceae bacterium]
MKVHNYLSVIIIGLLFLLSNLSATAQNKQRMFKLEGFVYDSFMGTGIGNVKVYLFNSDSVLIDTVRTDAGNYGKGGTNKLDAKFWFNTKKGNASDFVILKFTHKDYETVCKRQYFKYVGWQKSFAIPNIYMKRKNSSLLAEHLLDEVVVNATKVKVVFKGDTIVYNADAFNVADGSMLDALIKQMPGVELDRQGQIFVQGRKIDNLLLNGKDFFKGNSKMMLENLPYYVVKDIKVYNKTTDKALVLNDVNAKKDFVMDVNLKKEYSTGYMANMEAGAGTKDSYLGRLFGMKFTDYSRFTIVGGTNNLNMRNYSSNGYWSDGDAIDGRTTSKLLSAELLTENKRRKNVLTTEAVHSKSLTGSNEYQETYQSNNTSTYSVNRNSFTDRNLRASVNNRFTLKSPLWFESVTSFIYEKNKNKGEELYCNSDSDSWQNGIDVLDSLFKAGVSVNDPSLHNARNRMNKRKAQVYNASQRFSLAKNLPTTDIVDFGAGVEYSRTESESYRSNLYYTFSPSFCQENVTESIESPKTIFGADANLSYKIKRLLPCADLSFYTKYHYNYNKDHELITDISTSVTDFYNSYNRNYNGHIYTAGIAYDYHLKEGKNELMINFDVPFILQNRHTGYARHTLDTCIVQTYSYVEPKFSIKKQKWPPEMASNPLYCLEFSSSLKYSLPDALQLINLPITSDRINILCGNPNLKPSSVWTSTLGYRTAKSVDYFNQRITYRKYQNRIVNSYSYNKSSGAYTHTPKNINGTWDISYQANGFKRVNFIHHFSIRWGFDVNYSEMSNYVVDGVSHQTNKISNNDLSLNLPLKFRTSFAKRILLVLESELNWRKSLSGNNYASYDEAWSFRVGGGFNAELFAKISCDTELYVIKRNGYVDNELNKPMYLWQMTLSRSIMKNKITLKLKGIDILRQFKSVAYITNEQGVRETHSVSLPGYVLFTASFKFNKNPKKK